MNIFLNDTLDRIQFLVIDPRVMNVLHAMNINTVRDLLNMTRKEIDRLPSLGAISKKKLRAIRHRFNDEISRTQKAETPIVPTDVWYKLGRRLPPSDEFILLCFIRTTEKKTTYIIGKWNVHEGMSTQDGRPIINNYDEVWWQQLPQISKFIEVSVKASEKSHD